MDPNTPPNDKQPPLSDPQNVAGAMTPEFSPGGDLPVSGLNDGQHDDGFPKMDAEQSMTGFAANDFFENDQYTMKFLTVKGVRFEVHYLLMVVAFSGFDILFEARGRGIHVYSRVLMVPIVAVGMVFSVLGHELAHIIVMMGSGYMFEKAILLPLGGTVCLRVEASRLTQVMVAAAGPAFNVVLAVVCALLGKVFGTDDFVGNSFKIISAFNVSMAYWNLTMPVHPLDFAPSPPQTPNLASPDLFRGVILGGEIQDALQLPMRASMYIQQHLNNAVVCVNLSETCLTSKNTASQ
eukprot:152026_1